MNRKNIHKEAEEIYQAYSLRQDLIRDPLFYQRFKEHWPWFAIKQIVVERWIESGRKCGCCDLEMTHLFQLHVDHIRPKSKYPNERFLLSNLQILCRECNMLKGDYDGQDWRAYVTKIRSRNKQFGVTNSWGRVSGRRRSRPLPQSKFEKKRDLINAALGLSGVITLIFSLALNTGWAFLAAIMMLAFAFAL